jgi:hypothetical protein
MNTTKWHNEISNNGTNINQHCTVYKCLLNEIYFTNFVVGLKNLELIINSYRNRVTVNQYHTLYSLVKNKKENILKEISIY